VKVLELKITKRGRGWWKPARAFAAEATLQTCLQKEELGHDDFIDSIVGMRRMGKSFQACLESCRVALQGENVLYRCGHYALKSYARGLCLEILERSFPSDTVVKQGAVKTDRILLTNGKAIRFSTTAENEKGYSPKIIFEDEVHPNQGQNGEYWPHHNGVKAISTHRYLLSVLKETT
jgi:hypothetical protein